MYYRDVKTSYFRVEQITKENNLIRFYTGFNSYTLFSHLQCWGDAEQKTSHRRSVASLESVLPNTTSKSGLQIWNVYSFCLCDTDLFHLLKEILDIIYGAGFE